MNDTSVYSELDDMDDYDELGPPSATCDETGYMVPVDNGSLGHVPYYMVPLPSPPCTDVDENPLVAYPSNDTSGPPPATCDETGYMVPVDDGSPGPVPHNTAPLGSPSWMQYYHFGQEPTTAVIDSTGCNPPDASSEYQAPMFEGEATNKQYANVGSESPDTYTPLQPEYNDVRSSNTDAVPVSSQPPDDDYLTPVV